MFLRTSIIFSLFAMPLYLVAQQYFGGSGNGFIVRSKPNTILTTIGIDSLYKGGNNNGFTNRLGATLLLAATDSLYIGSSGNGFSIGRNLVIQLGVADSLYTGSNGNGFTTRAGQVVALNIADSLYTGGHGNGFNHLIITSAPIYISDGLYVGGQGNGFNNLAVTSVPIFLPDSLYNGGAGRGEIIITGKLNLDTCGINVTWNGNLNNVWANAANWDCGVVPGITSNVFIPAGVDRYPIIFSATEIKSLSIQNGASVRVKTAINFKINGY